MRFVAKLAFATILLVSSVFSQQPPTYRSRSELVVVNTVVTDHSGAHIGNLKKEDFSVLENGAEQKIVYRSAARNASTALSPPKAKELESAYSNFARFA